MLDLRQRLVIATSEIPNRFANFRSGSDHMIQIEAGEFVAHRVTPYAAALGRFLICILYDTIAHDRSPSNRDVRPVV